MQNRRQTTKNRLIRSSSDAFSDLFRWLKISKAEEQQFKGLCSSLEEYLADDQIEIVRQAYRIGAEAHDGQRRKSGENYINHPLAVACILARLRLDCATIAAAILHDTLEDTELTQAQLTAEFGAEITALVDGVSKVSKTEFDSIRDYEVENIRHLFSAMSKDIRVILIKLADRIHNLSTLKVHKLGKRKRIVRETQEIYIPIANLFGMYNWRQQMEDLCFKAMYPARYKTLKKAIRKSFGNRVDETIATQSQTIRTELTAHGLEAEVSGRLKNISSIHNKMKRKGNRLEAVQDLIAFRIIVPDIDSCYRALGVVHRRFKPIAGEFSDYIAIPKSNGYESLHTVVRGEFERAVEVQIRTEQMHRTAESGIASHLRYKSSTSPKSTPGLQSLNDLILRLEESETPSEYLQNVRMDLFYDYVHVFKPNGEIQRMKKGATVVDFAYTIHTDIGNKIKAATINGQNVPLNTTLRNGDSVKIITGRSSSRSLDPNWLNFVVTTRARMAIRKTLKSRSQKERQRLGSRLFSQTLKSYQIKASAITDELKSRHLEKLALEDWPALMAKIGSGELNATILIGEMLRDLELSPAADLNAPSEVPVSIAGIEGTVITFPKCCNPIPPEPIVGHMVPGRGFVIHDIHCPNVKASKAPSEHWVSFDWKNQPQGVFRTIIQVDAKDHKGVLAGVTARIAAAGSNICDLKMDTTQSRDLAILQFDIEVRNRNHLAAILRKLKRDSNVYRVSRVRKV